MPSVTQKLPVLMLALGIALQPVVSTHVFAEGDVLSGDIRITVTPTEIDKLVPVRGGQRNVNLMLHGVSLHDAFRALAKQAGFNVIVDESVEGAINVDLKNVSVQDALETLKTFGNLAYSVQNNSLIVAKAGSEQAINFQRTHSKIIPLHYANANVVSTVLNQVLYGGPGTTGGGSTTQAPIKVSHDFQTNSVIVVGSPNDIQTVEEHIKALDAPRESKTWRLSQANALDVAGMLSASLFNEGIPSLTMGSGGASSTSSGSSGSGSVGVTPTTPASMRVRAEKIQEGQGGLSAGGSGSNNTTVTQQMTLRAHVKEDQTIQVSPQGPIIMPDTRLNTITLMGTAEQIALAEALLPTFDRKVPQVVLETSLFEIKDNQRKVLNHSFRANANQFVGGGSTNGTQIAQNTTSFGNLGNLNLGEIVAGYTTNPIVKLQEDFAYQVNAMARSNQLKILANPTILTSHDNEAVVSIVDEVIRKVTTTANSSGTAVGTEAEIGEVGIVLNILPRIGSNNTVSMRVHPIVSTIGGTTTDIFGNAVTLLSKRDMLTQNVVLKEGESFVLGGLVNNTDSKTVFKTPGLAQLPILGALARANDRTHQKSELLIVITPHIINDQSDMARMSSTNPMVPVNLGAFAPNSSNPYVPVSNTGTVSSRSLLPPLEPVRTLDTSRPLQPKAIPSAAENAMPWTPTRQLPGVSAGLPERPMPDQSMMMIDEPLSLKAKAKAPEQDRIEINEAPAAKDGQDDVIRNIINRFRTP